MNEAWHTYNPKSGEFEKVKFGDLPKKPGYIILQEERKEGGFNLEMYSPSGKSIQSHNYEGSIRSVDRIFDDSLEKFKKEAHRLSTMEKRVVDGKLQKLIHKDNTIIYYLRIPPIGFYDEKLTLDAVVVGKMAEEPVRLKEDLHDVRTYPITRTEFSEVKKILEKARVRVRGKN